MTRIVLLIIFTLKFMFVFSQISIEGIIYDDLKKEPVEYAKIRVLNKNSGVITNTDGYFKMNLNEKDFLIISHMLYPNVTISSSHFKFHDTLFIHQKIQEIQEVIVIGSKNEVYDLIIAARKNLKKTEEFKSKAYLSFESSSDQTPLEMIQAYYNASINSNGPNELLLKNGRIGLSLHKDQYFVSLSTTKVLLENNLLSSKNNLLPTSPLQVSKNKLKKLYKIRLVSVENGLHNYHLIPNQTIINEPIFEAYIHINKIEQKIHRIELISKSLKKVPLIPINQNDVIDSFNIQLTYNFNYSDSIGRLDNIELKYDFVYQDECLRRRIDSKCLLLFYDNESLFKLPKGIYNSTSTSDYEKITYQPFNDFFWKNNEIICPSKKDLENEKFFKRNGVLLNFDSLKYDNDVFKNKIVFWAKKRMFLNQINDEFDFNVSTITLQDYHNLTTLSDHYNLEAKIFMDQNKFVDSTQYILKTIINLDDSFYHLQKNKNTTCFLNLYFDLAEVYKRKLESILNERDWTEIQVDSLYYNIVTEMKMALKQFLKNVDHGKNEIQLMRYIDFIKNELAIDNSLLIEDEEFRLIVDGINNDDQIEIIDRYNYGSELINLGRFKEALPILIEVEEMEDLDPWLFYNIGICYLKMEQMDKACEYFTKSGEYGERLEEKIKKLCNIE